MAVALTPVTEDMETVTTPVLVLKRPTGNGPMATVEALGTLTVSPLIPASAVDHLTARPSKS